MTEEENHYDHSSAVKHIAELLGIPERKVDVTIRSFFGMSGIRFFFNLLRKIHLKGFGEWSYNIYTDYTAKSKRFKFTIVNKSHSDKVIIKKNIRHVWTLIKGIKTCSECGLKLKSEVPRIFIDTNGVLYRETTPPCIKAHA